MKWSYSTTTDYSYILHDGNTITGSFEKVGEFAPIYVLEVGPDTTEEQEKAVMKELTGVVSKGKHINRDLWVYIPWLHKWILYFNWPLTVYTQVIIEKDGRYALKEDKTHLKGR